MDQMKCGIFDGGDVYYTVYNIYIVFLTPKQMSQANILACSVRIGGLFYSAEGRVLSEAALCHMDALKLAWRV